MSIPPQNNSDAQHYSNNKGAVIFVTASYDHSIRFWEAPSGYTYRSIPFQDSQVNKLAISPDRKHLAAAGNPHIRLFDINSSNNTPIRSFEGHSSNVTAIGFERDGRWLYTGSEDCTIKLWDIRAPKCQTEFRARGGVNDVTLHPNQVELISGDQEGSIRIWDLIAGASKPPELIPEPSTAVRSVSVSQNGDTLAACNNSGLVYIWTISNEGDEATYTPAQKIEAHNGYVLKCLIGPEDIDGRRTLATCAADHTVKLWDMNNNYALIRTLTGHGRWVWDCTFSADSAYLVTCSSDHTARLWDINAGETIRSYGAHHKAVVALALNDVAEDDM